ncbi:MAG: hypothetical protein R2798_10900 [Chitinophagales bacterium]|nr:hypothetical protein [Bacteroidota bacterium]MCB9043331.1 hypothetical protein [Chitinophagales bacterium]
MGKKVLLIALVIIGLALALIYLSTSINYSEGFRAGTIMKLSHKGVIFKTYEGELNTGGLSGAAGDDINSSTWYFSVSPSEKGVLQAINEAVDGGYRVKLHYKERYFQYNMFGDTKYFVYKVERVGSQKP